jgi:hypothetical protein
LFNKWLIKRKERKPNIAAVNIIVVETLHSEELSPPVVRSPVLLELLLPGLWQWD